MFFSKKSPALANKDARALLASAEKVLNYRGDLFSDDERAEFDADVAALNSAATPEEIATTSEKLTQTLTRLGGTLFPQHFIPEWVELIVVAAILAIGIRGFFFQPFKIPTNSMYPTYNGMTAQLCPEDTSEPIKWAERIFRSASFYNFQANASGEVAITFSKAYREDSTDIFELMIGDTVQQLPLPRDFSIDSIILERFFPDEFAKKKLSLAERRNNVLRQVAAGKLGRTIAPGTAQKVFIKTGVHVKKGDSLLNFKIFGGDMVLVDRFSYHFTKPEVGDPFVFRTHNIPGLNNVDLYYIKRLAGIGGDVLEVRDNTLFRNDKPIAGANAFEENNKHNYDEQYYGYLPSAGNGVYAIPLDKPTIVPVKRYYAMGDNSSNSFDSRGWGFVPAEDAIGKALFVLYPFSDNWGPAE